MYRVEVSKVVGTSWLLVLENAVVGVGHSTYRVLPRSAGVQANLEEIHVIRRPVCASLQKFPGGFLSLTLS